MMKKVPDEQTKRNVVTATINLPNKQNHRSINA